MAGREDHARLFFALDPPAAIRERLVGWARAAAAAGALERSRGALRILDEALLHVTVCFLGELPAQDIAQLADALASIQGSVGELSLGAPVWLPPRRPRALAVEIVESEPPLGALRRQLLEALPVVVGADPKRFRPHVTVARMPSYAIPARRELPPTPALRFAPPELVLYRSWLSQGGPRYEALARRPLELGR